MASFSIMLCATHNSVREASFELMEDVTNSDKIKVLILYFVYSSRKGRSHISGGESVSLAVELSYSYSHDSTTTQARIEEVLGMIQGLASAMQTSFNANKQSEAHSHSKNFMMFAVRKL